MSAITGGINLRYPGKARIHRRASCSWIQTEASRGPAVPNSSVMQLRADPFESGRRQKAPPREPASMPEDPLHRAGPWSKQDAPYTQHTTWDCGRQLGVLSTGCATEPSVRTVCRHGACQHAGLTAESPVRALDTLSLPPPPIQHITGSVNVGVGHDRSNFCRISVEECCDPALCFPDSHRGSPGLGFIMIQQVNEP